MELHGEQGQPVFYGAFREKEINRYLNGRRWLYRIKFLFLKTLFKWVTHSPTISTFSLMEFLDSLHLYH